MFINEHEKRLLTKARKLVEIVYQKSNHQFKEFPSLVTALDSLTTAIHKSKYQ